MKAARIFLSFTLLFTMVNWQAKAQGNCLDFDGTNDYVSVSHSTSFTYFTSYDFTVEFWIKTSKSSGYADIIGKVTGSQGWGMYLDGGTVVLEMIGEYKTISGNIADGTWHHIAMVKTTDYVGRGSTPVHHYQSYVDGSGYTSGNFSSNNSIDNTVDLKIGEYSGYGTYFPGRLEDLRIWNEARSQALIQNYMFQEVSGSSKYAYYKFNESSGSTSAADASGNGNTGTLHNFSGSGTTSNFVTSDVKWTYTSTANGLWSNSSTWTDGDIPLSSSAVEISNRVTIQSDVSCKDLKILSGGDVIIKHNGSLTVGSGGLTNSSGAKIEILSDIGGNVGSLVYSNGGSGSGGGTYSFKKYVTENKWHMVSTVNSATNSWAYAPAAVYYYTQSTPYWIGVSSGNLSVAKGYQIYRHTSSDDTVYMTGAYNQGTIGVTLSSTGDGYNLIGNPYPSTINWDNATIPSGMGSSIYVYDNGTIRTYTKGGGSVPGYAATTKYIPATQAFFVTASSGSPTFYFTESMRTNYKETYRGNDNVTNEVRIGLRGANSYDETLVRFIPEATGGFDDRYDGYKIFSDLVSNSQVYVTGTDDKQMSISSIPYSKEVVQIPLNVQIREEGEFELSLDLSRYEEHYNILLEDKTTGEVVDLGNLGSYRFNGKHEDAEDRFVLFLIPQKSINNTSGIAEEENANNIPVFAQGKNVIINSDRENVDVSIIDLLGQELYTGKIGQGVSQIALNKVAASVVIVQISAKEIHQTTKVFIQ